MMLETKGVHRGHVEWRFTKPKKARTLIEQRRLMVVDDWIRTIGLDFDYNMDKINRHTMATISSH